MSDHITLDVPLPASTRKFAPTKPSGSSGFRGVRPRGPNRFDARISVGGKLHHLGTYKTAEEASAAYESFAAKAEAMSADDAIVVHLGSARSTQDAASKALMNLLGADYTADPLKPRLIVQTLWLEPDPRG